MVGPVGARDFATKFSCGACVCPEFEFRICWHGALQRFQTCLHDEEEDVGLKGHPCFTPTVHGGTATDSPFRSSVTCKFVFMRLMTRTRCGGTLSNAFTRYTKSTRLEAMFSSFLQQGLTNAEAPIRASSSSAEPILFLNAFFFQQLLQAVVDDHRYDFRTGVK